MKEKLLTLTRDNFEWEYFCGSGNGGQNRNRRKTCVRVIHPPSGAVALGTEEREQGRNKQIAFKRICKHPLFTSWLKGLLRKQPTEKQIEAQVDEAMKEGNLKIEYGPFK